MKNAGTQTLETDRLILRRFTMDDAEEMYKNWASDPKVTRFLRWKLHDDVQETQKILAQWIPLYENDDCYNWVVELKDSHELIGNISVIKIRNDNHNGEIGYNYGSRFWGQGYATEALKAVIEYLLDVCEFHLVEAKHVSLNPASGRVMQKAGMVKEAVLKERSYDEATGIYGDWIVYTAKRK